MKKRLSLVLCALVIAGLLPFGTILAATIFNYYIPISISNNSSSTLTGVPILLTFNNTQIVALGYISASGLDTDVAKGTTVVPHMLADSKLAFFISSILGKTTNTYDYRLGVTPAQESFSVIVGYGGNVTIEDDEDLEPGDNFSIEFECYIPSWDQVLVEKEDAFIIYVYGGDVIAWVLSTPPVSVTATDVSVGEHTVRVWADGSYLYIEVT